MTIETDIQSALILKLCPTAATVSPAVSDITNPVTKVALPFVAYTPTLGTAYLDARAILRAMPETIGLPFASATVRRGIFQVDAVVPDNQGEAPGLRLAGLVAVRFAIGTKLIAGTYRLLLDKEPTIAAAVKDAPWVRFPVSIPYLVIT